MNYKSSIGLEIHAELLTKSKMFCSCENAFGGEPNTRICPVCAGFPGTLPVLNREAVRLGILAGLVLDCKINNISAFDRKNYFYPDLPKAFQITQEYMPICVDGFVEIGKKTIKINNIHLEEDAGKLIHKNETTMIDYNRCGVPLIEIVTEPDFSGGDEVLNFVQELILRLKYANICDGKLEQGSLRVDVNVSVTPEGSEVPGTRTEIKNLSSLKSIKNAVAYEIKRQTDILKKGGKVLCETRRFNENTGETLALRAKENKTDYKYFPEPDIPRIVVTDNEIDYLRKVIPVMPRRRISKYVNDFGLNFEEAKNIVEDRYFSDFYERVCTKTTHYKKAAVLMLVGLNGLFNKYGGNVLELKSFEEQLASIAKLWGEEKISSNVAMELLEEIFLNGGDAETIAVSKNMIISFNEDLAKELALEIIRQNPHATEDYHAGNKKVLGYFMGLVMQKLGKHADPRGVKSIVEKILNEER